MTIRVLIADDQELARTGFRIILNAEPALRAGARGFLLKDAAAADLLQAIRVIAAGEALLAPSITRRLIEDYAHRPAPRHQPDALADLTARELEVMRLLERGMPNTDIARDLFLGDATIKTHVARIFAKLSLHAGAQAVVLAYETGPSPARRPGNPAVLTYDSTPPAAGGLVVIAGQRRGALPWTLLLHSVMII